MLDAQTHDFRRLLAAVVVGALHDLQSRKMARRVEARRWIIDGVDDGGLVFRDVAAVLGLDAAQIRQAAEAGMIDVGPTLRHIRGGFAKDEQRKSARRRRIAA